MADLRSRDGGGCGGDSAKSTIPEVCVVYIQRRDVAGGVHLLLGRKKTGLGRGYFVAPGGKLELGETPETAAVREVHEEVGLRLDPSRLQLIGELMYLFPHKPEWSQRSWAYLADDPGGVLTESNELAPLWIDKSRLPFSETWDDAQHWLPVALSGTFVRATYEFAADNRTVVQRSGRGLST